MWAIRTAVAVEGEKMMICPMAVCVINVIVKFAKRARITATLTSNVPLHVMSACWGAEG